MTDSQLTGPTGTPEHAGAALFSPITLGGRSVANRVWVAPMCQYSVETRDGVPGDWHLAHLGSLATGRPGILFTEATAVVPEGRISPQDTGLWNDEQVRAWRRITDLSHTIGTPIGVQLAHAGRKASTQRPWDGSSSVPLADGGWEAVAPSAIAFPGYATPRELSTAEVRALAPAFARAAERAVAAGFDAVQLHAAHGYLIHEFLSPLANRRTDEYGGELVGRARVLLEAIRAVRAVLPAGMPLIVRFSGTDWLDDGWSIDDTVQTAVWAEEAGADAFDVSSGGIAPARIPVGPGYQVPLAAAVRAAVRAPVSAVGLITDAAQAQTVLDDGSADAVQLGRAVLRNPRLPLEWADALGVHGGWPRQYERASLAGS